MTTPDAELNKALWLDKTAFWHLKKTEQDVDKLRAALPKEVKDSLILWDRAGAVTADLIYAITVHLNKEKEAGRSWPFRATRDQARECIKAAKELLHNINLAQTVASTVETVDTHGVRLDGDRVLGRGRGAQHDLVGPGLQGLRVGVVHEDRAPERRARVELLAL